MLYSDWLNIQTQNQVNIHPPIGGGGGGDVNLFPKKTDGARARCLRVLGNITKPRKSANKLHVVLKQGVQQRFAKMSWTARMLVLSLVDKWN